MAISFNRRRDAVSALALLACLDLTLMTTAAKADEADSVSMIDELVVTASRREESVLTTPINMSAVGGEQLARAGLTDFAELTRMIPGIAFNGGGIRTAGGTNNFVIRGLNVDNSASSGDAPLITVPTVTTYLGETPAFVNLHLADIQRVEVLRGPQGTLYGSSSIGGTIRFLFNEPDTSAYAAELTADLSKTKAASGANYTLEGVANLPINENVAVRIAAGHVFQHGFIDAPYLYALDAQGLPILADPAHPESSLPTSTSAKDVDDAQLTYVRPSILFKGENLKLLFTFQHQKEKADGTSVDSYPGGGGPSSFTPEGTPGFLNPDFDAAFPTTFNKYETGQFYRSPYERTVDVVSLEAEYDFGFATLTSSTSYYKNEGEAYTDNSGFYQKSLGFLYMGMPSFSTLSERNFEEKAWVQELRLVSQGDGPLSWVVGGFYMDQDTSVLQTDYIVGWSRFATAYLGVPINEERGYVYNRIMSFKDAALFGELSYEITPKWQVTGGARAFRQELDVASIIKLPICGPSCSNSGTDPDGTSGGADKQKIEDVLFKFNTSYDFTDSLMAYFTYSEGQRRGGANGVPTVGRLAEDPAYLFFQPDTVTNYEIGLKGRIGPQVTFSAAIYQMDWDQPQLNVSTPVGSFPAAVNGGKARSRGLDLEGRWRATPDLSIAATYSYTDATLEEVIDVNGRGFGEAGQQLPGSPKHQGSISLDYDRDLGQGFTGSLHLDASYRGKAGTALQQEFSTELESFWLTNASFGAGKDAWYASVYADNITNERGVVTANSLNAYDVRALNYRIARPRTVGVRLTYKFP